MERLIDDVARVMTDVAPPAALRDAVLARIEPSVSGGRLSRRVWLAVPLTAAAMAVLAIALRDPGATVRPTPAGSPVAQTRPSPVSSPPAAAVGEPVRKPISPRPPAVAMSPIRSLAALSGPRALEARGIQPDPLAIPLLDMKPIVTEPIAIRTIDDGSGGRE